MKKKHTQKQQLDSLAENLDGATKGLNDLAENIEKLHKSFNHVFHALFVVVDSMPVSSMRRDWIEKTKKIMEKDNV